ncbi:MAG: protein kinase [Deltaproteobacteria bacterium]|nr:protein kinase [Deltaproteobacteria bacterium]
MDGFTALVLGGTFAAALAVAWVLVRLASSGMRKRDVAASAKRLGNMVADGRHGQGVSALVTQGKLKEALELAVSQSDFRGAGRIALKLQQPQRAAEFFERAGDNESAATAYMKVPDMRRAAECYVRGKNHDKAAEIYTQVGDLWAAAETLVAGGRLLQAAAVHRQLGNDLQATRLEAEALGQEGRHDEAARRYADAGDLEKAADCLMSAGKLREAARVYQQAGRADLAAGLLERAGAETEAAALYEEAGDHANAARLYQRVQNPLKEVDALVAAGDTLAAGQLAYKLGNRAKAEEILKMATPADRGFVRVCLLLGRVLEEEGRDQEAIRYYAMFVERAVPGEKTVVALKKLAAFLDRNGAKDAALRALKKLEGAKLLDSVAKKNLDRLDKDVGATAEPPKGISSMLSRGREAVPEVLADRYRITRRLGEGGTAIVYLAQDRKLKREVVLKFLSNPSLPGELAEDYFQREAEIVAGMSHPHIVRVFDLGSADGRPYIVMEYIEGDSLEGVLAREAKRGMAVADVARMATELGDALAYAHARQVIHRDLKPGNIMILPDGHAKLMDFGMAKALQVNRSRSTYICGTPDYMSPEQEIGLDLTPASDIYSFGLVLLEALLGNLPTASTARTARLSRLDALERSAMPEPVKRVIARCLALEPDDRPQDARTVASILVKSARPGGATA